jgi:hypothetical protein
MWVDADDIRTRKLKIVTTATLVAELKHVEVSNFGQLAVILLLFKGY